MQLLRPYHILAVAGVAIAATHVAAVAGEYEIRPSGVGIVVAVAGIAIAATYVVAVAGEYEIRPSGVGIVVGIEINETHWDGRISYSPQ